MKYAVVTGGSQGIGKAIVERLLKEGFRVAICARSADKQQQAADTWNQSHSAPVVLWHAADLATAEGAASFATFVGNNFPHVDLLVNNTGTYQPGTLAEEADGVLENMISVNLYSAYRLTRHLLPGMKHRGTGHIVNMCSVASLRAYPNGGAYSISKYALLGFSDNLREELREHGIRVTSLCPGATWSPSWEGSGIAQERIMEANDVATMVWAAYSLSSGAMAETIVMRPLKGDI